MVSSVAMADGKLASTFLTKRSVLVSAGSTKGTAYGKTQVDLKSRLFNVPG